MKILEPHRIRALLLELGDHVRQCLLNARRGSDTAELAAIARESVADTIYGIDRISEDAIALIRLPWPKYHCRLSQLELACVETVRCKWSRAATRR